MSEAPPNPYQVNWAAGRGRPSKVDPVFEGLSNMVHALEDLPRWAQVLNLAYAVDRFASSELARPLWDKASRLRAEEAKGRDKGET